MSTTKRRKLLDRVTRPKCPRCKSRPVVESGTECAACTEQDATKARVLAVADEIRVHGFAIGSKVRCSSCEIEFTVREGPPRDADAGARSDDAKIVSAYFDLSAQHWASSSECHARNFLELCAVVDPCTGSAPRSGS